MSKIKLNFINKSIDTHDSDIVIFQKNSADDFEELAVAWKVIKNCGRDETHSFTYPLAFEVSVEDAKGNSMPKKTVQEGQIYEMVKGQSGKELRLTDETAIPRSNVVIKNNLDKEQINVNVYRDGKLLAVNQNMDSGKKVGFNFEPSIFIGVVTQVEEGAVMDAEMAASIKTEIKLLNMSAADLVMTGGGADALTFHLDDVKGISG